MLPFHVDKLFRDDVEGTALLKRDGLKLIFHSPKEGQHIFDAEIEEVFLPWSEMTGLNIDRGMLSSSLKIAVKSDDLFPKQLKPKNNQLELTIRRGDATKLDEFEKDLANLRAGKAGDDTDDFIDDMRDFLDRM